MASRSKTARVRRETRFLESVSRLAVTLFCVSTAYAFVPFDAHAYLDPGTGSFVLQAVVASVMGAVFLTKTYWAKIKARFKGETPEAESDVQAERGDD
jgi:hypothetical protein